MTPFRRTLSPADIERAYREASGEAALERALRRAGHRPSMSPAQRALRHRMRPGVLDGIPIESGGGGGFHPTDLPGSILYLDSVDNAHTIGGGASGNNVAITGSSPNFTFAGPGITASMVGGTLELGNYSPANTGRFTIVTAGANTCTFNNPGGSTEAAGVGKTWSIAGMYQTVIGRGGPNGATPVVFTATGASTQFACNTSLVQTPSPRRLFSSGNILNRTYTGTDASVFSVLNGITQCTVYLYWYPQTYPGSNTTPLQIFNNGVITATWSGTRLSYVTAATGKSLARQALGGVSTSYSVALVTATNAWQGLSGAYNGASDVDYFLDGVLTLTSSGGSIRSLSGIDRCIFGCGNATIVTPGSGAQMMIGGLYVNRNYLGASTQAALTEYFRALIA